MPIYCIRCLVYWSAWQRYGGTAGAPLALHSPAPDLFTSPRITPSSLSPSSLFQEVLQWTHFITLVATAVLARSIDHTQVQCGPPKAIAVASWTPSRQHPVSKCVRKKEHKWVRHHSRGWVNECIHVRWCLDKKNRPETVEHRQTGGVLK